MSEGAGISSSVAIREELTRLACGDLLGPAGGPNEQVTEGSGRARYLTGKKCLFLQRIGHDQILEIRGDLLP